MMTLATINVIRTEVQLFGQSSCVKSSCRRWGKLDAVHDIQQGAHKLVQTVELIPST